MTRSAFHALRRLRPGWPFAFPGTARPSAAPARVIGIGVAGLGPDGASMLASLRQDRRVRIVAGCDPDEEARRRFARCTGVPACVSVEELARDPSVEAVVLPGADPCLVEQACTAARHGKHVLIEQPQGLSPVACEEMISACRAAGVRLLVGDAHSFDLPYLQARRIIEAGDVGNVRMIHALHYTEPPRADRLAGERWDAPGPGVIGSQAAHQVGVVRLLAGSRVVRVRAVAEAGATVSAQGAYSALLWFEDGAFATLVYSGHSRFNSNHWCDGTDEAGLCVDGTGFPRPRPACAQAEGTDAGPGTAPFLAPACDGVFARPRQHPHFGPVIVSCERGDIRPMPDAVWIYGDARGERRVLQPAGVRRSGLVDELHLFLCSGQDPLHDGEWACATLRVCEALQESVRRRCDVEL